MARTAKDYKVKHPYGATYAPWSEDHPHRGNDRGTPNATEVKIGNTVIGLTGNSGDSSGPHLHTQAGTDLGCQQTFRPDPVEFLPGKVVNLRKTDTGEWGKFVTLQVASGRYITYAHLSEVKVKVGQIIKEDNDMYKGKSAKYWYDNYQNALKLTKHHKTKRSQLVQKLKGLLGVK